MSRGELRGVVGASGEAIERSRGASQAELAVRFALPLDCVAIDIRSALVRPRGPERSTMGHQAQEVGF